MELIAIHPHALKHGLTETDITWRLELRFCMVQA